MIDRNRRSSRWQGLFFVMMVVGGFCIIGVWQSYDLKCQYGRRFDVTVFPPQFVCVDVFGQ